MSLGGGDIQLILRRIRNGFIICDDTEICDKIISQDIENERRRREIAKYKNVEINNMDLLTLLRSDPAYIDDELSHSPEWTVNSVHESTRRSRCETLGRLDEIKHENEMKRKVKVISWQEPKHNQSDHNEQVKSDIDNSNDIFCRRLQPPTKLENPSPLTLLLKNSLENQNPFNQYAKFDGTPNPGKQSKRFKVHLSKRPTQPPLTIIVSSQATVEQVIGFICYRYCIEDRQPPLTQEDLKYYSLYLADDDGKIEEDFPPLTTTRLIGQYDFPRFVLVEIEQIASVVDEAEYSSSTPASSLSSHNSSPSQLVLHMSATTTTPATTTSTFVEQLHRKSVISTNSLEQDKEREKEKQLHRKSVISTNSLERDKEKENDPIYDLNRLYESLNQKSYSVEMILKHGKHAYGRLDISGEQIKMEILEKPRTWSREKPPLNLVYSSNKLVDCAIVNKDKKKERIRLTLTFECNLDDGSLIYQSHEFDCGSQSSMAQDIQDQTGNIIKVKNLDGRKMYEDNMKRDLAKKKRSILNPFGK